MICVWTKHLIIIIISQLMTLWHCTLLLPLQHTMEADSFKFGRYQENLLCTLAVLWESSESGLRQNFSWTVLSCSQRRKGSGAWCYCWQPNHQKLSSSPLVNQWLILPIGTSLTTRWTNLGSVMWSSLRSHELIPRLHKYIMPVFVSTSLSDTVWRVQWLPVGAKMAAVWSSYQYSSQTGHFSSWGQYSVPRFKVTVQELQRRQCKVSHCCNDWHALFAFFFSPHPLCHPECRGLIEASRDLPMLAKADARKPFQVWFAWRLLVLWENKWAFVCSSDFVVWDFSDSLKDRRTELTILSTF